MNRRLWYTVLCTVALLSAASGAFGVSFSANEVGPFLLNLSDQLRLPSAAWASIGVATLVGVIGLRSIRFTWIVRRVMVRVMSWRGHSHARIARTNRLSQDAVQMLLDRSAGKRDHRGREGFSGRKLQSHPTSDFLSARW